jgi:DmsE family decaheme c-type cytochrome
MERRPLTRRWGGLFVLVGLGFLLPGARTVHSQTTAPEAAYVGSDTCAACHEDTAKGLESTPHGQRGFADLSERGCETCHGPGEAHVANPDDEAKRPRITELAAEQRSRTCLECHEGARQALWKGSTHESNGLSCDSCHSIHSPKSGTGQLKAATALEQCTSCHLNVRADLWKTSHHPLREGRMQCTDCHNPHGTPTDSLIAAGSVNDQCYECHTEKRGPFLWEHAPVRESCLNCHTPHGSNHIKLQKTSVPYICQQCHGNTRHPGTLYDATRLPTLENEMTGSNRVFNRACLDCHVAIHGSNHPSAPFLGR